MKPDLILLVDDNPITIFYNEDLIGDFFPGVKLITYEKSKCFLEEFLANKYSDYNSILLFLDINMPDYDGFEVLEEIEEEFEDNESLKVVMLTSSRLVSDTEKASRFTQVVKYIEKPITISALEALS